MPSGGHGSSEGAGPSGSGEDAPGDVAPAELQRIARLARLRLDEEEADRLAGELSALLERFGRVADAQPARGATGSGGRAEDGAAAPGPASADGDLREDVALREDAPEPEGWKRAPSSLAPEWQDGFFLVPPPPGLGAGPGDEAGCGGRGRRGARGGAAAP